MANRSIHESDNDMRGEFRRDSHSEHRSSGAPAGGGGLRSQNARELAECIPELSQLARQEPVAPTAAQWTGFSRDLAQKLDQEVTTSPGTRWKRSLRDRWTLPQGRALRTAVYAAAAAVMAALVAALVWLAGELAPAPAAAAALHPGLSAPRAPKGCPPHPQWA